MVELKHQEEIVTLKLKKDGKLMYGGKGVFNENNLVINFELENGPGSFELMVKDKGTKLEGILKNAFNKYEGERVVF